MVATSEVKRVHGFEDPLAKPVMQSSNVPEMYDPSMPRMYPIHRHIYIYSVAKRGFKVKHPYFKAGELKGCTGKDAGERYVKCYAVPDPPQQLAYDGDGKRKVEVEPGDVAGWRVAIDILNPNNPSNDPYHKMGPNAEAYFSIGKNVNLVKFGLFPSLNDPPTEAELVRAEQARDESYQELVDEAFQEQASNPQGFRNWLRNNPDITIAMEALGVQADWHRAPEMKMSCPNCGDTVKSGIAFHKSSAGVLCIIDKKRAAEAGVTKASAA